MYSWTNPICPSSPSCEIWFGRAAFWWIRWISSNQARELKARLEGKEASDRELKRIVPAMVHYGGCMLSLDHRIPNGVTIENYRHYIHRLQEIFAREGG